MTADQPRVLVVHNRYQQRGGEDLAFEAESALLEAHGHPVDRLEFSNDVIPEQPSILKRVGLARDTVWASGSARTVAQRASAFGADIVHFHNTFPLVSPASFRAARRTGAAVVSSIHNYRFVCSSGDLFRDGKLCTDCLGQRVPWHGVQHACYRDSRQQTAVVTAMLTFHDLRRTWARDVDLFLTPSQATADLIAGSIPRERLRVKPNFVPGDWTAPLGESPRSGFLFVGRLTVEKGVMVLLEAWRRGGTGELTVIGDGPLRADVEAAAAENPLVRFIGETSRDEVLEAMRRTSALIVPSIWQEPFGLVVTEAFACGTPVIAARSGALPEIVGEGETGFLYDPLNPDGLVKIARQAAADPEKLRTFGQRARTVFETRYSAEANYELMRGAYDEALRHRAAATV